MKNSMFQNAVENLGEQVKVKTTCNPEKLK